MPTHHMILNANYLAVGQSGTGGNLKYTFLTNESSIYGGMCVHTLTMGMQLETNRNLKKITKKANCEISFFFNEPLDLDYYCTMFLSYGGELIRKFYCIFISIDSGISTSISISIGIIIIIIIITSVTITITTVVSITSSSQSPYVFWW